MKSLFFVVLLVAISSTLGEADGTVEADAPPLKCYQCNSVDNPHCVGLTQDKGVLLQPCEKFNRTGELIPAVVCRKMIMYMDESYTEENKATSRYVRSCGYEDDFSLHRRGSCYYRSGYSTRTWTCSCKDSECNTAANAAVSTALLAGLALLVRLIAA